MDKKAVDEAPYLAARVMMLEDALALVATFALDHDARTRLTELLASLENAAEARDGSPLASARADVFRKLRMALTGQSDEYAEQLVRSLE